MVDIADWQCDFGGLRIGADTDYEVSAITGLLDLPDVRSSDRTLVTVDGVLPGDDIQGGRTIGLTVSVCPPRAPDFPAAVEAFTAAFQISRSSESPLVFKLPPVAGGEARQVLARVRRRSAPLNFSAVYGVCDFQVELFASDPFLYDATAATAMCGVASPGGGVSMPLTFPLSFGAMPSGGYITATNEGNCDAPWSFRVIGPTPDFQVVNVATGEFFAANLAVPNGGFVDVVMHPRLGAVLLNGTASRFGAIVPGSTFWQLHEGDNTINFTSTGTPGSAAQLSATWRSTWQ